MAQSLQKNIRVPAEQWDRIEEAAREQEVEEIRKFISTIVPDTDPKPL